MPDAQGNLYPDEVEQVEYEKAQGIIRGVPPPTPSPAPPPSETERGEFTPLEGARPVEWAWKDPGTAQPLSADIEKLVKYETNPDYSKPTVYEKNGIRYYTPFSTMWKIGYKTSDEYTKPNAQGIIPNAQDNPVGYAPWVAVKTYTGKEIHLSRAEAEKLDSLKGEEKFNVYQELKLIDPKADYYAPGQIAKQQLMRAEAVQVLKPYITGDKVDVDGAISEISKGNRQVEQAMIDLGYDAREVKEYVKSLREYEASVAGVKDFESKNTELPDGQWMANSDLADLKRDWPEGYEVATTKGYKAYSDFVDETNEKAIIPSEQKTPLTLTAGIFVNNEEYSQRVADTMAKRPHLMQYEAELMVAEAMKNEGKVVKQPGFIEEVKLSKQIEAKLSPEEKARIKAEAKELPYQVGELIVPGLYTGRHWAALETKDKVISIGVDVASVALIVFGGQAIGWAGRSLGGVNKAARIATQAGKAGQELKIATANLEKAMVASKLSPENIATLANKAQTARVASVKADTKLITQLEKINSISTKSLVQLEKKSGLVGLKKAVLDVSKASRDLDKAWAKVPKGKLFTTPEDVWARTGKELALTKVYQAQIELETALNKAGSVLKPRYQPAPPPDEFMGSAVEWKPQAPKIVFSDEAVPLGGGGAKKQLMVLERKVKIEPRKPVLKLKAVYEKAKPAVVSEKVKLPTVTSKVSISPGIVPKTVKERVTKEIPKEGYEPSYRETVFEKPDLREQEQTFVDARSRITIEELSKNIEFTRLTPQEWSQVGKAVKAGMEAQEKAATGNLTKSQAKQAVEQAVQETIELTVTPIIEQQPQAKAQPLMKTQAKAITKAILKTQVKLPPRKLSKPLKPLLPLREDKDRAKRELVLRTRGAVTWNMGKLQGRDVWWVVLPDGRKLVLLGEAPQGARILADGKGSAYKTTQRIGRGAFPVITQRHGAVTATIRPSRTPKGADIAFSNLRSIKRGKQYYTPVAGMTLISRRPLGRRRRE